ncbi:MAG: toxin-antitoxin system HicB family antitoxin [Bacteroidales bacterium]|nr:toxin-antitoxin system HicB family antitoxin [Bacteroidales bacterium]
MPAELHAKIAMSAQEAGISLNAYIQKILASVVL